MASSTGLPSLSFSSRGFRGLNSGSSDGFGFSGSNKDGFGFKTFKVKAPKAPKGPTTQQQIQAIWLAQQKNKHHSLLGMAFHDATHAVEKGLDYLSRPAYAVSTGVADAVQKKGYTVSPHGTFNVGQFLHGMKVGIEGGKGKKGFGQVLSEKGILQHHAFLRGAAGLGLDVAADPLTYVTGGASTDASIAKLAAEKGIDKAVLKDAIKTAQDGTFKNARHAMEVNNVLSHAGLSATRSLAREGLRRQNLIDKGLFDSRWVGSRHEANLHGLQDLSHTELNTLGPKMIRVGYKLPFTKGISVETKMKAPSLLRVAEGQGILGKFPGLPKAADTIGKAFQTGWKNEKFAGLMRMSKHVAEDRQDRMAKLLDTHLGQPLKELGLNEQQMLHALKVGETTPGIVTMRAGRNERHLSEKVLKGLVSEGKITQPQADFVRAWHTTTEALRKEDAAFGVKYDKQLLNGAEKNILYVPHPRELATGIKPGYAGSLLAKKGFQYERKGGSMVAYAEKLAAEHPDVAVTTHPLDIIAKRANAGALKQAETFMTDTVAKTFGIPTRLPDAAKQIALGEKYKKLNAVLDGMKTLDARTLAKTTQDMLHQNEVDRLNRLAQAGEVHATQELKLKRQIAKVKGDITKQSKIKRPTARQLLALRNEQMAQVLKRVPKGHAVRDALVKARATHKGLAAAERVVSKSVKDSLNLSSVTGARPHGSNYKGLVADLLKQTEGTLPKDAHQAMKEAYLHAPVKPRDSWEKRHTALIEDMLGTIKHERSQNADALQQLLDKTYGTQKLKNLKLTQRNLEQRLAKHQAGWDKIEAKINKRAADALTRKQMDLHALQHKELTKAEAIGRVLKKIERQVEYHNKSVKNPAAEAAGYSESKLLAPNGAPYALPTEMKNAMERGRQALQNDEFLQKFHDTWQKLVAKWKVGVTVVNPGYRVRNTLSDLWNAYISGGVHGGVPLWAMSRYGSRAVKLIHDVQEAGKIDPSKWSKEQLAAMQLYSEMYHHGVLAGLFQGDVEKVRRFLEGRGRARDFAKEGHFLKAATTAATNMNRHAENWGRMMHYLYRREFQHLSAGESAHIVRGAHFDYEDLTPTEQAIKRTAVPFYTWTRKNIPYQIKALATQPGKYAAFPLMQGEMNAASPQDPGQITPSWIKQGLGFHVPFGGKGNYYLPVFGPVDLEKVQHPVSQGASMLSPLIQVPAELMMNKNLNTGAPIYGSATTHPRNPISGFAASLLQGLPGTNVGQTSRNVNGKKMTGPGASPIVSYLAQQTPLTNFLVNAESNIKKAQRGGGQKAALSEFGGISTYKPDQQAQQAVAQYNAQQAFKQFIRGLRDQNTIPETKKRKVSAAAAANNRASVAVFGGR